MRFTFPALLLSGLLLTGCAALSPSMQGHYDNSADVYTTSQAQQVQNVQLGLVLSVRHVSIAATSTQTAGGSAVGAALGGLLGHQVSDGTGRTVATVVGALGGAVAGNLAGQHAFQQPGLAISVKLDNGNIVNLTQAADIGISIGDRVQLIGGSYYGQPSRVLPLSAGTK